MAFTDNLTVTVGDPTKASEFNNVADNTEFNREKANVEHNFDITTGDGTHKDVTATKVTMSGDVEMEGNQIWLDAAKAVELVSPAAKTAAVEVDTLRSWHCAAGSGAVTQILVRSPDGQDCFHLYSDTAANRYAVGYDDSLDVYSINRAQTLGTTKNWQMDSNGQLTSNVDGITATTPAYTIKSGQAGVSMLGLELHNSGAAAANSGGRFGVNVETTTNGETAIGFIEAKAPNIGAATYRGEWTFSLAGNGAAAATKAVLRSGYGTTAPVWEVRAPSASPIGLVVANDTFSSANSEDGLQLYVTDAGVSTVRSYQKSATAYKNLDFYANQFLFNSQETGAILARFIGNQAQMDLSLQASGTTSESHVRIRASGDSMYLITNNNTTVTLNTTEFLWAPSGTKFDMDWDGTGLQLKLNGTETYGGSAVVAFRSRQANAPSFIMGANGLTGSTGRLIDMIDNNLGGQRYGSISCYLDGTIVSEMRGTQVGIALGDFDNNAAGGRRVQIGRNNDATTSASGQIRITNKGGTPYFIWVDTNGKLRIGTTEPTSANDTSGTIVGTQT